MDWMKRGFLKSVITQKMDTSATRNVFKIPAIPVMDDNIPLMGRIPGGNTEMQPIKLPYNHDATEPYTVALLYSGAKEAIAAIPGFPSPYMPSLREYYRIDDAPGAGKGMYALTDLDTGDLIARERPLCIFPVVLPGDDKIREDILMEALLKMKPEDVTDYFELTNCKTGDSAASGILRTNGLSAAYMPGEYNGRYTCICRDICRINHSCSPNATYRWIFKDLIYELRAIRPIKEGEQIFVSYVNNLQSRSARQSHIQASYAFTCNCSACSMPPSEVSRSDIRRNLLGLALNDNVNNDFMLTAWAEDIFLPDDYVSSRITKFISMLEEERFAPEEVCKLYYSRLAKIYCALKDEKKAKLWAKRTALMVRATDGDDMGWNIVADSPESTDWWGRKKKA